jgi:hypothetical protein
LEDDVFEGAAMGFGLAVVAGALEGVLESDDWRADTGGSADNSAAESVNTADRTRNRGNKTTRNLSPEIGTHN